MTKYFSLKTNWPTLLSILVAFIFLQSLFFKLGGADITVHIFQTVGQWGLACPGLSLTAETLQQWPSLLFLF